MNRREHWEKVYATRPRERLGWYTPHLHVSLAWIRELNLPPDAPIIDVGGGSSTLVDDLLEAGFRSITVVDLSAGALAQVQRRLGSRAHDVCWLEGDITTAPLPTGGFALWHDRAALHFLTAPVEQQRYRDQLLRALRPAGHVILGTFSVEAPPTCSGLPVQRYSETTLAETLGPELDLVESRKELHRTPGGVEQMYLYCRFRRRGNRPA
jgi:SAM-dependent methyltransferase